MLVKAEGTASCKGVMVKICIKAIMCPTLQLFEDQHFIPGASTLFSSLMERLIQTHVPHCHIKAGFIHTVLNAGW